MMMDNSKGNRPREIRHERKRQKLGSPNPVCPTCGCTNLVALTGVPFSKLPIWLQQKLMQDHHIAMRSAGGWKITACLNCHAVFSDNQYDWDPRLRRPQTWIEQLAAFLQGLADWFRQLGNNLIDLASMLQEWVQRLLRIDPKTLGEVQP
jgi:hypothetical protein